LTYGRMTIIVPLQPQKDAKLLSNALNDLHAATANPKAVLRHVPFNESIAMKMAEVSVTRFPTCLTA
jgi:hypothetical protein